MSGYYQGEVAKSINLDLTPALVSLKIVNLSFNGVNRELLHLQLIIFGDKKAQHSLHVAMIRADFSCVIQFTVDAPWMTAGKVCYLKGSCWEKAFVELAARVFPLCEI